MKNKLYYFESDMGCGLRAFKDENSAKEGILREVGTRNYQFCREATEEDVKNVESMGGFNPLKTK
jgi:hypothetical protein